jgi:LysR family hydrogen peroxide-inducible transcriptional activator
MASLPTLRQMQYFAALAEHRSFSRAAEICRVSQSTLSAAIRGLEEAVEAELVDRSGRLVALTGAGEAVLARVRTILAEAEDLARIACCDALPLTGRLRLGVIPSIAPFLLPRALPAIRTRYPDLRLYLREDLTRVIVEDLKDGRLDAVLMAFPYAVDGLEVADVGEDRFLFAAARGHPLAARATIRTRDIAGEPLLLLDDGHCLRDHVLATAGADRREGEDVRATSLTTLVQMADNRLGVTLLPRIAVDAGVTSGTDLVVLPVEDARAARRIGLAWRRRSSRADDFRLLADELRPFLAAPPEESIVPRSPDRGTAASVHG